MPPRETPRRERKEHVPLRRKVLAWTFVMLLLVSAVGMLIVAFTQ